MPAAEPAGTWKIIAPRQDAHEYDVEHRGDQFYVRTNRDGRNFALALAPVADPSPANWKVIVPHRADVMLQGVQVFEYLDSHRTQRALGGAPEHRISQLAEQYAGEPQGAVAQQQRQRHQHGPHCMRDILLFEIIHQLL